MTAAAVAVVGTGRVGLTLARALVRSGTRVRLLARTPRVIPATHLTVETDWKEALVDVRVIIIAVPDDAIADAAEALAATGTISSAQVVLHTSGLHGSSALRGLDATGAALGSFHPLQAFTAGDDATGALTGVPVVLEGDPTAVLAARELALLLGLGTVFELSAIGKVSYHAAAVVASNYLVVLADIAERLARDAGVGSEAAAIFHLIMRQTLVNIQGQGTVAALTGPVRRGDVGTVVAHLAALKGADRAAYVALGREAVDLARRAGLAPQAATELDALFTAAALPIA